MFIYRLDQCACHVKIMSYAKIHFDVTLVTNARVEKTMVGINAQHRKV